MEKFLKFVQAQFFAVTLFRTPDTGGTSKITGEVTGELAPQETLQDITTIKKVVFVLEGEMKRQQLQDALQIKHNDYFRVEYISPALEHKYIELKYPNSINHPKQKYRHTAKGQALKAQLNQEL
ncbi:Fic family protein [Lunatimonas salinarum]|uniref:Fic family protein n=1 Tax=Lunatimonas salinarum TaxID=1774590 RepID=UPI001AE0647A|nr:hypothetical protein [Lunatimonas salinarum]